MAVLGGMYLDGLGVPQDDTRALEYYQQARAAGSDAATAGLGRMYLEGLGVPQDYTRALEYYPQARAAGVAEATAELGGATRGMCRCSQEIAICHRRS